MKSAVDSLFTLMNSSALRLALILLAFFAPLHVAQAQMVLYSGSNQSGVVSTTLANPLTVRFSAAATVTLDWTVVSGDATFQESGTTAFSTFPTSTSVARGDTESVHLVLGTTPGPVTVNAHCGGCDTGIDIQFTETINGHNSIASSGGDGQSGQAGTTLPTPLTVTFAGVSNATLLWRVTAGSATFQESGTTNYTALNGTTQTSNGQTSSVHLVLGATPGPVTVTATCSNGCDTSQTQTFNATVAAPPTNTMSISSGNNQSGNTNTALASPLTVSFSGTPVGAAQVQLDWQVTAGNATIQESSSATYSQMLSTGAGSTASVHLQFGATAGNVTVTATCVAGCTGSTQVTFNETIVQAPNVISIASGNNQSGAVSTTLPNPLTVSFSGAPAGGGSVQLDWQVTTGNATIEEGGNSSSYSQMIVTSAGSTAGIHLMLGASAGNVSVTATCTTGCTGSTQVTFNATIATTQPVLNTFAGDNQSGAPGSTLPTKLEVLLTPPAGFAGGTFPVNWTVESGSATFVESGGTTFTDNVTLAPNQSASGDSAVTVKLGQATGAITVSASCSACSPTTRTFQLTSAVVTSATLAKLSGDNQTGVIGGTGDAPLVVQLGTPDSSSLSGQAINWSVVSGDATLSSATTQTDTTGHSQITFRYGPTPGPIVIEAASIAGKVDFNVTSYLATSNIASGNNQTGAIGTTLAPFVVQIGSTQPGAKGLTGVPVQWTITSGAGTLTAATTFTNSSGQASNTLTLGSVTGDTIVTATIPGNSGTAPNVFTAHAIGSASISKTSGDQQSAPAGTTLQPFVVQVVVAGQSAPGITVDWAIVQGGGTLASGATISDASGLARNTLTLGAGTGSTVVSVSIGGLGVLSFSAFSSTVANGSSQFAIVSGDNQGLTPGQPSKPLIVKLVSPQGQPVNGAVVQWSVTGQTGTLAATNTPTDSSGQAQNTLTVILPGNYTVTAQLPGNTSIPALTFHFGNGVSNLPSLSPTQQGVAGIIDKACPALAALPPAQLTPAQQDLLKRCTEIVLASGNNPGQVPGALGQLTNNKSLPQRQLATNVQLSQNNNLNIRLAELRQGGGGGVNLAGLAMSNDGQTLPLAMLGTLFRKDPKTADDEVGKDFERWGFFATGMIERGGFNAANNRPGFDFHNTSLTAGVDYRFNDALVGGVALGYNKNDSTLDNSVGKLTADSYSVNGYFTWYHAADFYIEGSLTLDWLGYDLSRNIAYQIANSNNSGPLTSVNQRAIASPDGHTTALSLSIGKDFNRGAWNISPYLRGVYSHLSLDSFSETVTNPNAPGAGLATSVDARSVNSAVMVGGARISYTTSFDWGVLVPNALIEWNHELRNDPQVVVTRFVADPTQTPMLLTDQPPDSNYFNIGLGLNAVLPKGRSAFFLWEHLTGYSGAHENRYSLGIRIEF